MESAFGIDHGDFSKADASRVGFTDKAAYKRTKKEAYKGSSVLNSGHGNGKRVAQGAAIGAGVGAGIGAGVGGHFAGKSGAKVGAGIGALWGGGEGAGVGNRANMRHSGVRAAQNAATRGDLAVAGPGTHPSKFRRIIREDRQ